MISVWHTTLSRDVHDVYTSISPDRVIYSRLDVRTNLYLVPTGTVTGGHIKYQYLVGPKVHTKTDQVYISLFLPTYISLFLPTILGSISCGPS